MLWLALAALLAAQKPAPLHALDALTAQEIKDAVAALSARPDFPKGARFAEVSLVEPPKLAVLDGTSQREALLVLIDREKNATLEARVALKKKEVLSLQALPGRQAAVLAEEFESVPVLVRADPRWQAAMKKRGITNLDHVLIDVWAPGRVAGETGASRRRLLRAVSYFKGDSPYFYARPIEGVVALVDVNARKVVSVTDREGVSIAADPGAFDERSVGPLRAPPRPLTVAQPSGPSFTVTGSEVRWQKWRFRFTMHPREGLVLHQVGYEDGGRVRPVLYRASLSEMVVPYGDPDSDWEWRSAFDVGEYGIGKLSTPLERGQEVPENAQLFGATFADDSGKPYEIPRSVALYERDSGVLWRHFDFFRNKAETRRGRELWLSVMTAVSNYDYGLNWIFRQDGTLELRVDLTGIMLAKGVPAGQHEHAFGHLVAPGVLAPHHQHFFNFRLDLDVDGTANQVAELTARALPKGERNPYLNAFAMDSSALLTERAAARDVDVAAQRRYIVQSTEAKNALGESTGYVLLPGHTSVPYALPDSPTRKRAGFLEHHFWATAYRDDERFAAGDYPTSSEGGEGLPAFIADDAPLSGRDVVVWYTFGVTHLPRPEEWPVMPVAHEGFMLAPAGFFSRNPALDLPAAR